MTPSILSPRFRLALIALFFGSIAVVMLASLAIAHASGVVTVAGASPVPTAGGWDLMSVAVLVLGALGGLGMALGGLAALLHVIAKRTATTLDDRAADFLDGVHDRLDSIERLIRVVFPGVPVAQEAAKQPVNVTVTNVTNPAPVDMPIPGGGSAATVLAVLLLGASALQSGCGSAKPVIVDARDAIVDCSATHTAAFESMLGKLVVAAVEQAANAVKAGALPEPNWSALASQAWDEGKIIGSCAFVQLLTMFNKAPVLDAGSSVLQPNVARTAPDAAAQALGDLRAKAGVRGWKLADGAVR